MTFAVYDQLRNYPTLSFVDKGKFKGKNIDRPIHAFSVQGIGDNTKPIMASLQGRITRSLVRTTTKTKLAAAGLVVAGSFGISTLPFHFPRTSPSDASILVLPFRNVSGDASQQYFADALTSDVATDLSRMRDVVVLSPGTAFAYAGQSSDPRQINREIGVRYLIIGSIRRTDQQVNTSIQLIDAESGVQLWGERFQNELIDLAKLEETVTGRIAASLNVHLVQAEGRRAERTAVPDALDLRLRATSAYFRSATPENMMTARRLLQQAVRLDPGSAEAWARLAQLTASDYLNRWNNTGREQLREAENAASKALSLDPNLALAHLASGFVHRAHGEHQLALEAFTRAIELDPNSAMAYAHRADELILTGRPLEALPLVDRAIRLSPRDPSLGIFQWISGRANFYAGKYDQAIPPLRKSVELRPNVWYNGLYLVSAYALSGDTDNATRTLESFNQRFSNPTYTLATVISNERTNPSTDPFVVAARDRLHRGLLLAGMAEN